MQEVPRTWTRLVEAALILTLGCSRVFEDPVGPPQGEPEEQPQGGAGDGGSHNVDSTPGGAGGAGGLEAQSANRECNVGEKRCGSDGRSLLYCRANQTWDAIACASGRCDARTLSCEGVCERSDTRCSGSSVETCQPDGNWGDQVPCPASAPSCVDGRCTAPPSCELKLTCGQTFASCCASPVVRGGTFDRGNQRDYPARVSDFRLDSFEITVGRFRRFLSSYPHSPIPAGAGKNSRSPQDVGWRTEFDANLAEDAQRLTEMLRCDPAYSTMEANDDSRPINCLDWYTAMAFCVWDGGRLPTEAEWNYVASGGSADDGLVGNQWDYPWGSEVPSSDAALVAYGCFFNATGTCTDTRNIAPVGSIAAGNSRWGHSDIAGNVWEWMADSYAKPYTIESCVDCVFNGEASAARVTRGGAYLDMLPSIMSRNRSGDDPRSRLPWIGARCARDL